MASSSDAVDDSSHSAPTIPPTAPPHPSAEAPIQDDSDPDFDDLDDVLDQFNTNAPASSAQPPSQPPPSSSGPGRPIDTIPIPSGPAANETEDEFMARLTKEMSSVMSKMGQGIPDSDATPEDLAKMGKELEEFTYKMEAEGIKPEDLLKAILGEEAGTKLGEAAHDERDRRESQSKSRSPEARKAAAEQPATTFEDTIRRTMARMEDSSNKATTAVQEDTSEEDMLANLMKALGEGAGGADGEGDMSKMLLGMMEQLTNKEMLYEPMAELNTKFPDWLSSNKAKLKTEDYARYARQKDIVKEIVDKFEEKGYSDEDPKCREFIWEKMQLMQEQGAPPEELIQNPIPGMGGMPGAEGLEEGCPTQ